MSILVVMDLKSRPTHVEGITTQLDAAWVRQVARNLTDEQDGFLRGHTHLLIDRDTKFLPFRDFLEKNTSAKPIVTPLRSPNCNAHMERWFDSLKSECLGRMVFFSRAQLEAAVDQYVSHFHMARNHQALDNTIIEPADEVGQTAGVIDCRERLGGLLRYYHRRAA